jgi:hypothetical protein
VTFAPNQPIFNESKYHRLTVEHINANKLSYYTTDLFHTLINVRINLINFLFCFHHQILNNLLILLLLTISLSWSCADAWLPFLNLLLHVLHLHVLILCPSLPFSTRTLYFQRP